MKVIEGFPVFHLSVPSFLIYFLRSTSDSVSHILLFFFISNINISFIMSSFYIMSISYIFCTHFEPPITCLNNYSNFDVRSNTGIGIVNCSCISCYKIKK